jgi:diadenosine tetraphosphate (Ap4A) HIT family hydrolase
MSVEVVVDDQVRAPHKAANCLFCRFEDQSVNKIFIESTNFYARFDNYPAVPGHVEVVPKRHVESFFELSQDEAVEAYELLKEVSHRLAERYDPAGYTIGINEGRAAGRSVDHLHIHLIPRHDGDVVDPRGGIRQILPNCHPSEWLID